MKAIFKRIKNKMAQKVFQPSNDRLLVGRHNNGGNNRGSKVTPCRAEATSYHPAVNNFHPELVSGSTETIFTLPTGDPDIHQDDRGTSSRQLANEMLKRVQHDRKRLLVRRYDNGDRSINRLIWYWKDRKWFRIERTWSWADRRWEKRSIPNRPVEINPNLPGANNCHPEFRLAFKKHYEMSKQVRHDSDVLHDKATFDPFEATFLLGDIDTSNFQHAEEELLVRRYNNGDLGSGQVGYYRLNSTGILPSFRPQGEITSAILPSHSDTTTCHPEFSSGSAAKCELPKRIRHHIVSRKLMQAEPGTYHHRRFEPKGEFEAKVALMNEFSNAGRLLSRTCFGVLSILILMIGFSSCKKFVEIPPPQTSLTNTSVFSSNATANAAQLAIFNAFALNRFSFNITTYTGETSDELLTYPVLGTLEMAINQNAILADNGLTQGVWSNMYSLIYQTNLILDALSTSTAISANVQKELKGEAKFSRALLYFYLVNLYGDVPLITTSLYSNSSRAARMSKDSIYRQIVTDLKDAQSLVNSDYVGADGITPTSSSKLRPNKAVVRSLLARVYLYLNDYKDAEVESTYVIDSCNYHLSTDLNSVFLVNSNEAIFQVTYPPYNSLEGYLYILQNTTRTLNPQLLTSFESSDKRKIAWIDSVQSGTTKYYYPYKYKVSSSTAPITELTTLFRLSEQYLIRSEAEVQLNNYSAAINDLNIIRNRAGLATYSGASSDEIEILSAILHERQIEFFCEEGHRWLDLKRMGKIDSVMRTATPLKGGIQWNSNQQLWPIPQSDIISDPHLTQNIGY